MTEKMPISEQLIQRLFEQVSKDSENNSKDIKDLIRTVQTLTQSVTMIPSTNDILNTFKDFENKNEKLHNNSNKIIIDNLTASKITFSDIFIKLDKIYDHAMGKFNCLQNKLKTMITIVLVAFSLLTVAYFFVSASIDNRIDTKVIQIEKAK